MRFAQRQVFDLIRSLRQRLSQPDQLSVVVHIEHIFDPHAELLFWNVNSGLDGENHAWTERDRVIALVVDIQSYIMAEPVNVPLTGMVRVMSEAYIEYSPAASIKIRSPDCIVAASSE